MKKAQAGIIAIILIILIILIGIVIIWNIVNKTIKEKSKEIDLVISVDLRIENVLVNNEDEKIQVEIKRGNDNNKLSFLKFVIIGDNQETYTITDYPKGLEKRNYVLNINKIEKANKILIYPVSEKGNIGIGEKYDINGDESSEINNNLKIINPDEKLDCIPDLQCEDWDNCHIVYDLDDIIAGGISLQGKQTRLCIDINKCIPNTIERKDCNPKTSILLEKVEKCNKQYLEVYDKDGQELISRLELIDGKLYIQFILDQTEYFPYCYNNIQDCGETNVDCGGDCIAC